MKLVTKNILFKGFKGNQVNQKIKKNFKLLLKENNSILRSLSGSYIYSYNKKLVLKLKKFSDIVIIGMGGSILGAEAIYSFLKFKINKNFLFLDNLKSNVKNFTKKKN